MANLKRVSFLTAAVATLAFAATPALAKPVKPVAPKAAKPAAPKAAKPTTPGPKATGPKAKAPKTTSAKPGKSAAPSSASAKGGPKSKATTTTSISTSTTGASSTTSGSTTNSTTSPTATDAWKPTNPVAEKLSTKPNLLSKVESRLPKGIDLNYATLDFKNFGQFIAAVNVSNHHHIDFAELKAAMTGTTLAGLPTGEPKLSLGQAIQELKPTVQDPDAEATKALSAAETEITTSTTPVASTAKKGNKKS